MFCEALAKQNRRNGAKTRKAHKNIDNLIQTVAIIFYRNNRHAGCVLFNLVLADQITPREVEGWSFRRGHIKKYKSGCRIPWQEVLLRAYGGCLDSKRRWRTRYGCDKLRVGAKQPLIRRSPNGGTPPSEPRWPWLYVGGWTWGSETSQYPEEKRTIVIP